MTPLPKQTQTDPVADSLQSVEGPAKKTKKEKKRKASKGVETLFRTTIANHIKLSEMADGKANLMISINTIVVSIILSAYVRDFDKAISLLIPSMLLLVVCLVTIIISVVATHPTTTPLGRGSGASQNDSVDLLFFGSYTRLTADEYRHDLKQVLNNDEVLYNSLIDNVYAQGQVLARKYRLLKFAYQFFMIGFPTAVVIAAIALFYSY